MTDLGRLERITDIRRTWPDEARNFTPWLAEAENLSLLAEELGLGPDGLELEAVEKFVGPYRADILCRNTADASWVLIENQLERTDHSHLGQLICYAAGLEATTVIWISREVTSEHKAALEWLNTMSGDGPSFFAIEIELWRIGDSKLAPRFNFVVRPNDWTRSAYVAKRGLEKAELSETASLQLEFWTAMEARNTQRGGLLRPITPPAQMWVGRGIGKTGFSLNASVNNRDNWVRVEIYLSGPLAKTNFWKLHSLRHEIEASVGPLEWQELPNGNDSRIALTLAGADPSDRNDWLRQHDWLIEKLLDFDRAFRPKISRIDLLEIESGDEDV